jgi:hypothetical protein
MKWLTRGLSRTLRWVHSVSINVTAHMYADLYDDESLALVGPIELSRAV